jgi:hypothetical protein
LKLRRQNGPVQPRGKLLNSFSQPEDLPLQRILPVPELLQFYSFLITHGHDTAKLGGQAEQP